LKKYYTSANEHSKNCHQIKEYFLKNLQNKNVSLFSSAVGSLGSSSSGDDEGWFQRWMVIYLFSIKKSFKKTFIVFCG